MAAIDRHHRAALTVLQPIANHRFRYRSDNTRYVKSRVTPMTIEVCHSI